VQVITPNIAFALRVLIESGLESLDAFRVDGRRIVDYIGAITPGHHTVTGKLRILPITDMRMIA